MKGPVTTAGEGAPAVGREGHAPDRPARVAEAPQFLAGPGAPDDDGPVLVPREQPQAVARDGDGAGDVVAGVQVEQLLAGCQVPGPQPALAIPSPLKLRVRSNDLVRARFPATDARATSASPPDRIR